MSKKTFIDDEDEFFTQAEGVFEEEYEVPEIEGWELSQDDDSIPFYGAEEKDKYEELEEEDFDNFDDDIEEQEESSFLDDIDFSDFSGSNFRACLKNCIKKVNKSIDKSKKAKEAREKKKALLKEKRAIIRKKKAEKAAIDSRSRKTRIPIREGAILEDSHRFKKPKSKIIVPNNKKIIIEGVDKFMLSQVPQADLVKKIGYYKGKKLQELLLFVNNENSLIDFNFEIFNPSNPLDYVFSTSNNLNNKVQTSNPDLSYSDVLFNILANPVRIHNAQIIFSGTSAPFQGTQYFIVKQKRIAGIQTVNPIQLSLNVDPYQFFSKINYFTFSDTLGQPYIPNGLDVVQYKVLAGSNCTFCFFYEQVDLRKLFYDHKSLKERKI